MFPSQKWSTLFYFSLPYQHIPDRQVKKSSKKVLKWKEFSRSTVDSSRQSILSRCILRYMWDTWLMIFTTHQSVYKWLPHNLKCNPSLQTCMWRSSHVWSKELKSKYPRRIPDQKTHQWMFIFMAASARNTDTKWLAREILARLGLLLGCWARIIL